MEAKGDEKSLVAIIDWSKAKNSSQSQSIDEYSTMSNDINAHFCGVVERTHGVPLLTWQVGQGMHMSKGGKFGLFLLLDIWDFRLGQCETLDLALLCVHIVDLTTDEFTA